MSNREIRPYLIIFKDAAKNPARVFTSDDPGTLWQPSHTGDGSTLELKADGQIVFKCRHADIHSVYDIKNDVIHSKKFNEDFKIERSRLSGPDGNPLN